MAIIDSITEIILHPFKLFMRILGLVLGFGIYILIGMHAYAFFTCVAPLLRKRLGVPFGLLWVAIGFTILYNLLFNHLMAMIIKPGNSKDLIEIEIKKKEI